MPVELPRETTSWVMLLVGMSLLVAILLRNFYRYRNRLKRSEGRQMSAAARRAAKTPPNVEQPLMDAPPEILRWQVEMHETARVLKAELDSKMGALQALSRIAREEAQRLEAAIERAEKTGLSVPLGAPPSENDAGGGISERPPMPRIADANLPGEDRRRLIAYQMADSGHSPAAIADALGAAVGEVEMILSLRGGDASA